MLMIVQHLFNNIFDDVKITTVRLANFAEEALNRLLSQNQNKEFDLMIGFLETPVAELLSYISAVDVALGIQKGKTLTNDEFIKLFKKTMSDKEGVIADAMGGFNTPAFIEFYPKGVTEYSKATKTNLPTLISRVNKAATTHKAKLSPALLATLQAFESSWQANRDTQVQQKGTLSDSRADRNALRTNVEMALLKAVHATALAYPGDVEKCTVFYKFHLLYPVSRAKKDTPTPPVGQ